MVDFVSPVDTQLSNNHMNDLHLRLSRGIDAPYGLAVDYSEDYLYWCDRNLDIIERVSIVSGLRTVISTDLTDCVAIDVFEGFVYWADAYVVCLFSLRLCKNHCALLESIFT